MSQEKSLLNLFNEAVEKQDAIERARFLDQACGADAALRQRVEKLLRAHDEAGGFFSQPSKPPSLQASLSLASTVTEKPGDKIGRYKLLQQIGEGGCGVVYMAEQEEPVRRRVALKVIKLGMDTKQVIARFEAERQALALMDHPNIAKVFDAGSTERPLTPSLSPDGGEGVRRTGEGDVDPQLSTSNSQLSSGRPYFVMELVRGQKITEFCDENKLSTEDRLDLFIQVCHAIQHAHQKGIIHRDIKPSNILVTVNDGVPVPKVIDFGIAKATAGRLTDQTLFTAFEQFIGTPAYMSPEQAVMTSLDIDTRSDIYSLGVLLYELLTGSPPFDQKELLAAGLDEMRRTIREKEPAKPSTRLTQELVAADVSPLKSKDKEATVRADLRRLLQEVRGDLDWIAMKCLEKDRSRRYETANALAADIRRHLENEPVVARPPSRWYEFQKTVRRHKFGFAAAATLILVLAVGVLASTWQAVRATKAERLANDRLSEAEQARAEAEAISTFMNEVIQSPDPTRDGRTIQVVELLDRAAKKLEIELAGQPERKAKLQATLGKTYYSLGLYREAIPLQEKVRDYYLATSGLENTNTLQAMHLLAISYGQTGRRDDALKIREEVLALRRKLLGPEHPDTLNAIQNLATSYVEVGRRDEALKMREAVLTLQRKVNGPEHRLTLFAMNTLATSYDESGLLAEALKIREEVLTLCRKLLGPEHPDTLDAMIRLALSYNKVDRSDEAVKLSRESLALSRKVLGPEHPSTINAKWNTAICLQAAGFKDEALKLKEEVLAFHKKERSPEDRLVLGAMSNLASSYRSAGRLPESISLYEQTLATMRRALPPNDPYITATMDGLAQSYRKAGRRDDEFRLREEKLAIHRKTIGLENQDTAWDMITLAWRYRNSGTNRLKEAIQLEQSALEVSRRVSGQTHRDTLNAMTELATSYRVAGRITEAIPLEEESLRLKRQNLPPGDSYTIESLENLATCYEKTDRNAEAEALRQEAAELKAKAKAKK